VAPGDDIKDLERALEALRRREQQLRHIADAMPALISYVDADRRYRFVNRQYETWFRCTREEVLGKTMEEVLGAEVMARGAPTSTAPSAVRRRTSSSRPLIQAARAG